MSFMRYGQRGRAGAPTHWLRDSPNATTMIIACGGFQPGDRRSSSTSTITCLACLKLLADTLAEKQTGGRL